MQGTMLHPIGQCLCLALVGLYNKEAVTTKKDGYDKDEHKVGNASFYGMTVEPYRPEYTKEEIVVRWAE